jgi:hypothetical protein
LDREEIIVLLRAMPEEWRHRWCESGPCACIGAANCSGGLRKAGVTREQYDEALDALDSR